eukprot:1159376-Pelagomonas_calceolata.AAC.6
MGLGEEPKRGGQLWIFNKKTLRLVYTHNSSHAYSPISLGNSDSQGRGTSSMQASHRICQEQDVQHPCYQVRTPQHASDAAEGFTFGVPHVECRKEDMFCVMPHVECRMEDAARRICFVECRMWSATRRVCFVECRMWSAAWKMPQGGYILWSAARRLPHHASDAAGGYTCGMCEGASTQHTW